MRAVCVDDEQSLLEFTTGICREMDELESVDGFTDAVEAYEWLRDHPADVAILDIEMPKMDGMDLAAKIQKMSPETAIIFLAEQEKYAVDAFAMHVLGYLLKPVDARRLREEIVYAKSCVRCRAKQRIRAVTFGNFDLVVDGKNVDFKRSRAKELLAYLIDKQGAGVTRVEAFSALYENSVYDRPMQKQFDVIVRSLRESLRRYDAEEIFELHSGYLRVCPEHFDCDLYRFLKRDPEAVNAYRGEYMNSYSWANFTEAYVTQNMK